MRIVALFAALGLSACTTFDDAATAADAATPADGGATSDASTTDGGATSTTGCGAAPPGFLFCSDFDEGTSVVQLTKPGPKQWSEQKSGAATLAITSVSAFSGKNVLTASGDGTSQTFQAQAAVTGIVATKPLLRLAMQMRIGVVPSPTDGHDVYLATMAFDNALITAVLHPDGSVALAQISLPGNSVQKKSVGNGTGVAPGAWRRLEIYVNRAAGRTEASATLDGVGPTDTLVANPTGNVGVSVGIGYCDAPCGKPSIDFDDVVLTEE